MDGSEDSSEETVTDVMADETPPSPLWLDIPEPASRGNGSLGRLIQSLHLRWTEQRQLALFLDEKVDSQLDLGLTAEKIAKKDCEIAKRLIEAKLSERANEECTICSEPLDIPVRLPCEHTCCLECTKGQVHHDNRCAFCRVGIPSDFVSNPETFVTVPLQEPVAGHLWFYKSRAGWWAHTPRLQINLESEFQSGKPTFENLFNGMTCVFDFEKSIQTYGSGPTIKQQIKRDTSGKFSHLGVAGIKYVA